MKKQLKKIKNEIVKLKKWKQYKIVFRNKNMRLLTSYIILVYQPIVSVQELINIEMKLLSKKDLDQKSFMTIFDKHVRLITTTIDYDWLNFGKFIWFTYQTSTYFYDKKNNIRNIYGDFNYIELNNEKRELFHKWLNSIPIGTKDYNKNIKKIIKKVF